MVGRGDLHKRNFRRCKGGLKNRTISLKLAITWLHRSSYVDLQDDDEGTQAKVEADNFVDKFKQAYENEQFEEVLDLFISKVDSVCQIAENDQGTSKIKASI